MKIKTTMTDIRGGEYKGYSRYKIIVSNKIIFNRVYNISEYKGYNMMCFLFFLNRFINMNISLRDGKNIYFVGKQWGNKKKDIIK